MRPAGSESWLDRNRDSEPRGDWREAERRANRVCQSCGLAKELDDAGYCVLCREDIEEVEG